MDKQKEIVKLLIKSLKDDMDEWKFDMTDSGYYYELKNETMGIYLKYNDSNWSLQNIYSHMSSDGHLPRLKFTWWQQRSISGAIDKFKAIVDHNKNTKHIDKYLIKVSKMEEL